MTLSERLERELGLYLQEMKDGCPDCIALPEGVYCQKHEIEGLDVIIEPRKFIKSKRQQDKERKAIK